MLILQNKIGSERTGRKVRRTLRPWREPPGRKNDAIACHRKFYESNLDACIYRKNHDKGSHYFEKVQWKLSFVYLRPNKPTW